MAAYRDIYGELRALNVQVAGISVDPLQASDRFRNSLRLPFPLLSDLDRSVLRQWQALNSKARGGIAFPSTWVIDDNLGVLYRVLERKAARVDPKPVLGFLRGELAREQAIELSKIGLNVQGTMRWTGDTIGRLLGRKKS